jgi:hypothetical protein
MAGHDYENEEVTKAVHEFAKANGLVIATAKDIEDDRTNEWWYRKDDINEYDKVIEQSIVELDTFL